MKYQLLSAVCVLVCFFVPAQDTTPRGEGHNVPFYRKLWAERTKGNILSKGKKVTFSIPPNYRLTNDEKDPYDLTDGKISGNSKELIWFGKDAVGWFGGIADGGVNFQIDLGEVRNVDRLVIRCLGGEVQKTLGFPKLFEVYVSKDGKNYYRTAVLQKLAESDRELSDFKQTFYLPERGAAYVYPFEFEINAEARFVAFRIASAAGGLFADELAVMEGNPAEKGFNAVYETSPVPFYTKGLLIRPKPEEFVLAENIVLPSFFTFADMRSGAEKKSPMFLELDLPEGVTAIFPKAVKEESYTDKAGHRRVKITMKVKPRPWSGTALEEIFFQVKKPVPAGSTARFTSFSGGVEPIVQEFPFRTIEILPVPELKRIHASLAWMGDGDARKYPGFFKAWKTLGFNAVNCFPRYFSEADRESRETFFGKARRLGMKVVMTDSPIHAMPGKGKKGHEMNCLVDGIVAVCPSYRGKFHQKEVERIRRCTAQAKPDFVFFDIEAFYSSHAAARKCSRCLAAMKAAGMNSMDEFARKAVAGKIADFHAAVVRGAEEAGIKHPPIGLYGKGPGIKDLSQPVLSWDLIYPGSISISQPSLYVGERPWLVRKMIRRVHMLMDNRNIIPWLTAGTYGEIRPQFVEYNALEALLNGAGGITYYAYWDFDNAMKYAALAKALRMIAPYENLIMDGAVTEIPADGVNTSAVRKGNEMLLLVGNYRKPDTKVSITLPFKKVEVVRDIRDGEKFVPSKTLDLKVKRSGIRLIYVKGE